jgi:hypothetical protein
MEASGQLHAPAALFPGILSRYLLDRRLGGPQNRSGHWRKEKSNTAEKLPLKQTKLNQNKFAATKYTVDVLY